MRFRILGPLDVEDGGNPVAVGGPKPRTLLAALLVNRGTVVTADRLVDAVWPQDAPPGAVSALRAYVSRLRTALGPPERLSYRAPGYLLSVDDDELDATQFEQRVAEARSAVEGGDHPRALDVLDIALSLWHGDALAEFAHLDFAAGEAARLEELRIAATEDRADALLHCERSSQAVAELEALVRRFLLRERPVALLMRALYRSGRQGDALVSYHRLRRRLDEELGVEPGESTQATYRQILLHDTGLVPSRVRGNLPRRATSFVGRDQQIDRLVAALGDVSLLTLTGPGGVGKSRLAIEVAAHEQNRFPDGVWLCELAPLSAGSPIGHTVATALRVQQRQALTIEQTLVEYLRERTALLILDNCEHVLDACARMVDQILQHCPQVTVLATSREGLGVLGEQVWAVPPLESEDAAELFDQRARASRPDFRPDHEATTAIAQICRYMDGLPLGIELAAARIRAMSPAEIAGRLDSVRLRSGGARTAQPRHQSLSAAIDWSYRLLSEPEQRLFARLSVFAGGCDLRAIHAVCGSPGASEDDTLDLLTRLVDKSMVSPVSDRAQTRYHVLETLRGYGRDRLDEAGLYEQVARSQAWYFADLMELAAQGLQGPDERHWVARVLPDYDNLRGAFERAVADHDAHLALRLVTSVTELAHLRVGYEGAGWAERTVELAPQDAPLFTAAVGAAARGAWNRGDFTLARVLVARAGSRPPGRGTGRIAYPGDVLADVALYEGDVGTALHHYESETERARTDHDPIRLVWTLYYVAVCHAVQRAPHLGLAAARESLEVADTTSNPTAQSMARYALGLVTKKTDPDRALDLFDQASDLAASVQNFWWHGIALMEAAATRAVHRDATTAARALVDVLDHWDRVGDWTQQWLNLRYVVRLLLRVGAHEDAVELHHYLRAVGKPSPLDPAQLAELLAGSDGERIAAATRRGSALSGAAATTLARACLRRIG